MNNKMFIKFLKENSSFFILIFVYIFIDQISKAFVLHFLGDEMKILPFFNIVNVINHGVSFGMFRNFAYAREFFSIFSGLVCVFLGWSFCSNKSIYQKHAIILIFSGAIGNLVDRIFLGGVVDFLDFYISRYHYPAFNFADSFICIGVFMLLMEDFVVKFCKNSNKYE
jgi:signal peptidase II